MASKTLTTDFTSGSIPGHLTRFMLPFMASNALQVFYSVVDMIIVGNYVGSAGMTAVSQGSLYVNFIGMLAFGFLSAGQIISSQLMGAGRPDRLTEFEGSFFTFSALVTVGITVVAGLLQTPVLTVLKLPGESMQMGREYVAICIWGILFVCGYNAVTAIMRGLGDSRHPLIFIAIATAVNLVLDIWFVGGLSMGTAGAAWATIIGQGASFAAAVMFFWRNRKDYYGNITLNMLKIDREVTAKIISLGIPMSIMSAGINITMLFVNRFVNSLDTVAASATFGAGVKLDDIANKISLGIQMAAAPMIGQNFGAGRFERMKKTVYWTWFFSVIIAGIFIFLYLVFGRQMFSLFVDDPEVLDLSRTFILASIWTFPAVALMRGGNSLMNGIGHTKLLMILSFLDSFLRAAASWFFGFVLEMGFFGFVLGFAIAPFGVGIPGAIYFFSGRWQNRKKVLSE